MKKEDLGMVIDDICEVLNTDRLDSGEISKIDFAMLRLDAGKKDTDDKYIQEKLYCLELLARAVMEKRKKADMEYADFRDLLAKIVLKKHRVVTKK